MSWRRSLGDASRSRSQQVDQVIGCDVATNPNFNGGADKELLASGASLDVGAKARVIFIVSVYPRPDPPVYTLTSVDDGTSQLGTLVTKSDGSDVLLGPGIVSSADDYVLFGEQFVKLEAIANSFGHIGSNDFVEVRNRRSNEFFVSRRVNGLRARCRVERGNALRVPCLRAVLPSLRRFALS